MITTATDQW